MSRARAPRADRLDYRPSFPQEPFALAIVGCGTAARDLHLPANEAWNVDVAGVYDLLPAATAGIASKHVLAQKPLALDLETAAHR